MEKKEVAKGEKPKNSTVTQARKPVEKDELLSQMQHFFQTNIIFLEDQLKDHLKEMERRLTKAERTSQVLLRTNLAAIKEHVCDMRLAQMKQAQEGSANQTNTMELLVKINQTLQETTPRVNQIPDETDGLCEQYKQVERRLKTHHREVLGRVVSTLQSRLNDVMKKLFDMHTHALQNVKVQNENQMANFCLMTEINRMMLGTRPTINGISENTSGLINSLREVKEELKSYRSEVVHVKTQQHLNQYLKDFKDQMEDYPISEKYRRLVEQYQKVQKDLDLTCRKMKALKILAKRRFEFDGRAFGEPVEQREGWFPYFKPVPVDDAELLESEDDEYEDGSDTDNTTQDTILDEEDEEMTSEKTKEFETEKEDQESETENKDKELHPFIRALFKQAEN